MKKTKGTTHIWGRYGGLNVTKYNQGLVLRSQDLSEAIMFDGKTWTRHYTPEKLTRKQKSQKRAQALREYLERIG